MSNELIIEAYRQQNRIIPSRNSYYLRCLRSIGHWRGPVDGKTINDFVELETTNGKYADDDVPDSYSYFNLDYYRDFALSDDSIIGSFYARLEDTPNDMEPRKHLWRIGDYRKSEKIKAAAEESACLPFILVNLFPLHKANACPGVTTAEQAEVFLGVHADTPDDFVISMYTAKVCLLEMYLIINTLLLTIIQKIRLAIVLTAKR